MKQTYKPGDIIGVHVKSPSWPITEGKGYKVLDVYEGERRIVIKDDIGRLSEFHFTHVYPMIDKKPELSGGLSDHYLADVKKPQRGGDPYQAECDDIIFALNMTFDEGEAFKAIWRTCTARLGYGKKGNTALYNAQKLVHRSKRILQRAELTGE